MNAHEIFERVWNGDPNDISTAWLRVIEHMKSFGNAEGLRTARIEYLKSLPVQLSNQTLIHASGRIIKVTTKQPKFTTL